jgi:hypothetical protein
MNLNNKIELRRRTVVRQPIPCTLVSEPYSDVNVETHRNTVKAVWLLVSGNVVLTNLFYTTVEKTLS